MKVIMMNDDKLLVEISPAEFNDILGGRKAVYRMSDLAEPFNPSVGKQYDIDPHIRAARQTAKDWNNEYSFKEAIKHIDALKENLTTIVNAYVQPPKKLKV